MKTIQESRLGYGPGDRVKIHPASDWFMRGVRFATVTKIGRRLVHLDSDDGFKLRLRPSSISGVAE